MFDAPTQVIDQKILIFIDPLGRPTGTASRYHYFHTCRLYVRPYLLLKNLEKQTIIKWK